ncbi:MAG: hypothetical protein D6720_07730 [Gammaproteobacteria bacterium]|nr:MAG: hypothetical protein D6720_07730 [Gammaproteobacteria bacterium]
MVLDDAADLNMIGAYAPGEVRIRGAVHSTGLLVYPRRIEADCPIRFLEQLANIDATSLPEEAPDILIIGTGEHQRFPPASALRGLIEARIGFELMDNAAACRTFNILLSEGRKAALLLLADD